MTIGLDDVVAAETVLSHVDGEAGRLIVRGHDLEDVAGRVPYENAVAMLWDGFVPLPDDPRATFGEARARAVASTDAGLLSAVVAGLCALKGPLHGGAPGPVLDTLDAIGSAERAEAWLDAAIARNERLMGFGHRVYKVRDPRADVLKAAAERMYTRAGDMSLYTLARQVEATAIRLLEEYKPGRRLQTNVEFYTALLLHGLGLDVPLFTPTFATARVSGWIAHAFEQRAANRLIRPRSEYVGPHDRRWQDRGAVAIG